MNRLQKALNAVPGWQDNLRASCLKVGFSLHLSRPMCEFLSAVADGVVWDRSKYGSAAAFPDNWLATSASLFKRGLVRRKPDAEREAEKHRSDDRLYEWTGWELTPAGEHVVGLLKLAGLFVEADAATEKKAKAKGRVA